MTMITGLPMWSELTLILGLLVCDRYVLRIFITSSKSITIRYEIVFIPAPLNLNYFL
jgi:hypothetical protein